MNRLSAPLPQRVDFWNDATEKTEKGIDVFVRV
jgi:hypothetical protein